MKIETYKCDRCELVIGDYFGQRLDVEVLPAKEELPIITVRARFSKSGPNAGSVHGSEGAEADLCNACKQLLLQKAIDTL